MRIGGCCPDGYLCQTADNCIPPASVSYTYECSVGSYLCPAELNYGCCPNGMGCGVNQCFSTEPSTRTTVSVATLTVDGEVERSTTTVTTTIPARTPTTLPRPNDENYDPELVKFFPPELAKVSPTASPDDDDSGGGGGLSTGALVGIVIGAVAFLIIVLVAAFIIIRHLNKVVAAVGGSKGSTASRPPVMVERPFADDDDTSGYMRNRRGYPRGYSKPTDSDYDARSVDPSIVTPRPDQASSHTNGPPTTTTDVTGTSFAGNYQAVSTANTHNMPGYFDVVAALPPRQKSVTRSSSNADHRVSGESDGTAFAQASSSHVRQLSDVSDESSGNGMTVAPYNPHPAPMTELHGRSIVPELYGSQSPNDQISPLEEARRRSTASSLGYYSYMGGNSTHQRARNGNGSGGAGAGRAGEIPGLGIVDEEIHGFYGPSDGVVGATRHDPDDISGLGVVDEEIHGFYGPSDGVVGATRNDPDVPGGHGRAL